MLGHPFGDECMFSCARPSANEIFTSGSLLWLHQAVIVIGPQQHNIPPSTPHTTTPLHHKPTLTAERLLQLQIHAFGWRRHRGDICRSSLVKWALATAPRRTQSQAEDGRYVQTP